MYDTLCMYLMLHNDSVLTLAFRPRSDSVRYSQQQFRLELLSHGSSLFGTFGNSSLVQE